MLGWLRAAAGSVAHRISFVRHRTVSLIADWLAGALWLLDTAFLTLARKAYGGNAVAYACVRLLSQSIPEAPLRCYQEDQEGNREELPRDHPLRQLIRRPNELQTEYEFWELTTIFMAVTGSAFWWKQRDNSGAILALWPLRPDRVGPIYSDSDKPGERVLLGWSYQDPGSGAYIPIARRDVLSFNLPDPADESGGLVEGLGPLQVLASEISADNEATRFVGALLRNYAMPSLMLKVKREVRTEAEAKLLKALAQQEFGGDNRGRVALLDSDAEAQMLGFNLEQLEFPDLRAIAETRIAAAVGVPAILVGLKAGLDKGTYSNFDTARAFFAETTLSNYWRRYSDQMSHDLAPEYGEGIVCEFDTSGVRALAGQRVERIQPIKDAFLAGAATLNQYLEVLGLDPDPNGDVYYVPNNVTIVPRLDHVKPPEPIALPPPSPSEGASPPAPGEAPAVPGGQEAGMVAGKAASLAIKAADPRDNAERRLRDALVAMFEKTAPMVAERIAAGEAVTDEELAEAFRSVLQPNLAQAATEEGLKLGAEIGVQFDPAVVNAAAAEWAKDYTYALVKDITATTRKVIASAVEQFVATPGMTMGELRDLLSDAFSPVRAEMISTTETTRAFSSATTRYMAQLEEQGVKMHRVWKTSKDERTCVRCVPLDNKPESVWSSDHPNGPPAHVNCRCSTTLQLSKAK